MVDSYSQHHLAVVAGGFNLILTLSSFSVVTLIGGSSSSLCAQDFYHHPPCHHRASPGHPAPIVAIIFLTPLLPRRCRFLHCHHCSPPQAHPCHLARRSIPPCHPISASRHQTHDNLHVRYHRHRHHHPSSPVHRPARILL